MNLKKLHTMFHPKTIAVIGASNTEGSVGYSLIRNLVSSGFVGTIYPVNPKHENIQGVKAYPSISQTPDTIDLAIIATPASKVPDVVKECAEAKVTACVIVSAGFKEAGQDGQKLMDSIRTTIEKYDMTILGPNCLGFIRPSLKLNASFSRKMAKPGGIAFISQSGALCSAVLDWSVKENVGFSYFVSVGEMLDIGYHDLIDYFGNDPETTSILIYMESLTHARRFLSAARGFARTKPIIVLKSGKSFEGAKAALSHTGSITGNDQIFDAAFKRVGILRVSTISELFDCAKTLSMQERPGGNKLAIVTNAGGPGVIATDMLIAEGGQLAILSKETLTYLDEALPPSWSHANPIDVLGDADPVRYKKAIDAVLNDQSVDGVIVILTPQAVTDAVGTANELVVSRAKTRKTILSVWMGEDDVAEGRRVLEEGKIPAYEKPEDAIRAFINMYRYEKNLELLYQTPGTIPHAFEPKTQKNKQIISGALAKNRFILTEPEAKEFLSNYDIAVPRGDVAHDCDNAVDIARKIGFPVVMKIVSPDVVHKIDVGGVALGVFSPDDVKTAYKRIIDAVKQRVPYAQIEGVYIEEMVSKRYELLIGCKKDPIFGPAIVFGMGGIAVEVFKDTNIGLPPLNMTLAARIIEGTKIFKLLSGYRGVAGVDVTSVQYLLYKFAYLVMDFPEIAELDINPFAVDEKGQIVLDAKVILDEKIAGKEVKPYSHMVISPYPRQYEKNVSMKNGKIVFLRPIRPEDEPMEADMFKTFSEETQRFRFFGPIKNVTHELLIRYTQIDYDREIAIIAEMSDGGKKFMTGVVRVIADPYNESAEFAIVVGDPWQKQGLGTVMMEHMLDIAGIQGIQRLYAYTLTDNAGMLHLFEKFHFSTTRHEDMYKVELMLR